MTLKLATHHDFGVQVCQALGLEPSTVHSITLSCDLADGGAAHVEVHGFVPADAVDDLAVVTRKFLLIDAEQVGL